MCTPKIVPQLFKLYTDKLCCPLLRLFGLYTVRIWCVFVCMCALLKLYSNCLNCTQFDYDMNACIAETTSTVWSIHTLIRVRVHC